MGRTAIYEPHEIYYRISTHSPRVGRTGRNCVLRTPCIHFNSLAPCGANRPRKLLYSKFPKFQLTRPVWGEPCEYLHCIVCTNISTHSPRVGRTFSGVQFTCPVFNFNSLAPCGANRSRRRLQDRAGQFQLTRPVWGEPKELFALAESTRISTHSPRVGRTAHLDMLVYGTMEFQLTRPVWGEPWRLCTCDDDFDISTHSPRVGRTPATAR